MKVYKLSLPHPFPRFVSITNTIILDPPSRHRFSNHQGCLSTHLDPSAKPVTMQLCNLLLAAFTVTLNFLAFTSASPISHTKRNLHAPVHDHYNASVHHNTSIIHGAWRHHNASHWGHLAHLNHSSWNTSDQENASAYWNSSTHWNSSGHWNASGYWNHSDHQHLPHMKSYPHWNASAPWNITVVEYAGNGVYQGSDKA